MTADAPALDTAVRPDRTTMLIYLSALVAMFMAAMDMQIVVTALPTIAGELGNLHLFGWVGSAYLLSTAAVSPFYGKLGDMFGRKPVVMFAIVLFLVGSLACGMAWSMESLIAARVLQGLGGGGLMVSAFANIGELFAPRERAKYQGYTSAVFALSSILGPVDRTVENMHHYFDPFVTPPEAVDWLGAWVGLALDERWPEDRRRELISEAVNLYQWRGTKRGLSEFLRLYTGVEPEIIEPTLREIANTRSRAFRFTVRITLPAGSRVSRSLIESIIDAEKPAFAACTLELIEA